MNLQHLLSSGRLTGPALALITHMQSTLDRLVIIDSDGQGNFFPGLGLSNDSVLVSPALYSNVDSREERRKKEAESTKVRLKGQKEFSYTPNCIVWYHGTRHRGTVKAYKGGGAFLVKTEKPLFGTFADLSWDKSAYIPRDGMYELLKDSIERNWRTHTTSVSLSPELREKTKLKDLFFLTMKKGALHDPQYFKNGFSLEQGIFEYYPSAVAQDGIPNDEGLPAALEQIRLFSQLNADHLPLFALSWKGIWGIAGNTHSLTEKVSVMLADDSTSATPHPISSKSATSAHGSLVYNVQCLAPAYVALGQFDLVTGAQGISVEEVYRDLVTRNAGAEQRAIEHYQRKYPGLSEERIRANPGFKTPLPSITAPRYLHLTGESSSIEAPKLENTARSIYKPKGKDS